MPKTPSYRARAGYSQALVTLSDSATGRRRDYWLGEHSSPESREDYLPQSAPAEPLTAAAD